MSNDKFIEIDKFKYNITKISLILAILITLIFCILRILGIISHNTTATLNGIFLLFFLIIMYYLLIRFKNILYIIQFVTYIVILTFIGLQTNITNNISIFIWIDFAIITAFLIMNKRDSILISLYAMVILFFLKPLYMHKYLFITFIMSLLAFSLLGYLISSQFEKFSRLNQERFEQLQQLALIDDLTQIYNRRSFFEIANTFFKQSKREHKPLSIIMLDIDHFKKINDTYGHEFGDIVLKEFAKKIKLILRENDIFARIGGEEFVILLYNISQDDLEKVANKILQSIRNMNVNIDYNTHIKITVSLGIYTIKNENTFNEALVKADKALYTAKNSGRNKAVFY